MSARFNRQHCIGARFIQFDAAIDDIPVAGQITVLDPAKARDERLQVSGCRRIRDDGGAWLCIQQHRRNQRNQIVAVERFSVAVDDRGTVHIRVEDDPKIGLVCDHRILDALHCRFVVRIRDVVRESAVRIQELATGSVGPQRLQHPFHKESARSVAGVHDDVASSQWFLRIFR